MNELYNAYMTNPMNRPMNSTAANPMQRMNQVMQAMRNPVPVILQAFPDIPAYMQNSPEQMLQYIKQTRGISDQQIQNIFNPFARR